MKSRFAARPQLNKNLPISIEFVWVASSQSEHTVLIQHIFRMDNNSSDERIETPHSSHVRLI